MNVKAKLEYLRGEIRAERISWGELAELRSLGRHIEIAGLPESEQPFCVDPKCPITACKNARAAYRYLIDEITEANFAGVTLPKEKPCS